MLEHAAGGEQLEGRKRNTYIILATMYASPALVTAYFHFFNRTSSFDPTFLTAFWVLLPITVLAAAVLPRFLPSRTLIEEQTKSIVCISLLLSPALYASVIYHQGGPISPLGFAYAAMAVMWFRVAPDWSAWEGEFAVERPEAT
jgi:hypothetical protein